MLSKSFIRNGIQWILYDNEIFLPNTHKQTKNQKQNKTKTKKPKMLYDDNLFPSYYNRYESFAMYVNACKAKCYYQI